MPSRRVTRVLQRIIKECGAPEFLRSDNGPEVSSRHYLAWCVERSISTIHIQPGKPTQNGHVESFHGRIRDECLNTSWFWNLWDARRKVGAWRIDYNQQRPHSSLNYQTPAEFAREWALATSPSACRNTTPPEPPQGQALRAPAAVLTRLRLRGRAAYQKDDAAECVPQRRIAQWTENGVTPNFCAPS
jgi:putative transposase